jgi:hypothetical protein
MKMDLLPLVLIASASLHERRLVESTLERSGFTPVGVDDAEEAGRELAANGASGVLVIDSGLLEAAHDSQWRQLRTRHPGLGAVVRCLIPRVDGRDRSTLLVHPDDDEGLRRAVRMLAAASRSADCLAPPNPIRR